MRLLGLGLSGAALSALLMLGPWGSQARSGAASPGVYLPQEASGDRGADVRVCVECWGELVAVPRLWPSQAWASCFLTPVAEPPAALCPTPESAHWLGRGGEGVRQGRARGASRLQRTGEGSSGFDPRCRFRF